MKIAHSIFLILTTTATSFTEVDIKVTCKGVQFNKLSVPEITEVSHALENSYADVHPISDYDNSQLTNVHWAGRRDTLSEEVARGRGSWSGDFDCEQCPADDDVMLGIQSTASHKKWESKFLWTLASTERPVFKFLKSCHINMSAKGMAESQLESDGDPAKCGLRACAVE